MKLMIQFAVFTVLCLMVFRYHIFHSHPEPVVDATPTVSLDVFTHQKDAYVGDLVKLNGIVKNTFYGLGTGYYLLESVDGERVWITCQGYPPICNKPFEAIIYVYPLLKAHATVTLQIEVLVPQGEMKLSKVMN